MRLKGGNYSVDQGKVIQQQEDSKRNPPKPSSSADSTANQNGDAWIRNRQRSRHQQVAPQKQEEERDHKNDAESKLEGNRLFVEDKYDEALVKYEVVLGVASGLETNELRSICHLNHEICFFKLEKYENTIRECTKALKLNPKYM
ncbi:hypothetical protein QYF36_006399 [Acer negundo]|nr:hypothetical protein QYF36_006399 [Acer negundo]